MSPSIWRMIRPAYPKGGANPFCRTAACVASTCRQVPLHSASPCVPAKRRAAEDVPDAQVPAIPEPGVSNDTENASSARPIRPRSSPNRTLMPGKPCRGSRSPPESVGGAAHSAAATTALAKRSAEVRPRAHCAPRQERLRRACHPAPRIVRGPAARRHPCRRLRRSPRVPG